MRSRTLVVSLIGIVALLATTSALSAANLVIGLKDPSPTMDPHWMTLPSAAQINRQIFESLVTRDESNAIRPGLAARWETLNETTWVFHLQRNAKFSDGTPFTAHDIVFTYHRARNVPNAPTSFVTYLQQVEKTEAVDDHTLRITTTGPAPTLLDNLSTVLIVSKKHGEKATTDEYNSGKVLIGTGPYKFVSWTLNDNTTLERNPDYWGEKPLWDRVTYKMIPTDATRIAALLAGDADVIESVPIQEIDRLKTHPAVALWTRETSSIVHMLLDGGEETLNSGKIMGPNGEKLTKNPLADQRVREALKFAVDIESFASRIYQSAVTPTGQFVLADNPSYNPDIKPWKADPDRARKLLAESGWAGKFKMDLGVVPSRFQNALQVSEGLAQSWTRVGVPTSVTQMPYPVSVRLRNERLMPVYVLAYRNQSGSMEFLSPTILHSKEPARSFGTLNSTQYSNKEVDRLIEEALVTSDDAKRAKMMQQVTALVDKDAYVIPLWLSSETTGTKKNLTYRPRLDSTILPESVGMAGTAGIAK